MKKRGSFFCKAGCTKRAANIASWARDLFSLALLGSGVGFGVSCFLWSIGAGERLGRFFSGNTLFFLPGALVLCGLLEEYVFPGMAGHGMETLKGLFVHPRGVFPPGAWFIKAFRTVFTLGAGGSGGIVGPSAYVGAALWDVSSFRVRREKEPFREGLVFGAAAGIAVVLGTPLGAAFFVVESFGLLLGKKATLVLLFRAFWCSFWAAKMSSLLHFFARPHMNTGYHIPPLSLSFLGWCLGAGIFFGLLSIAHVVLLRGARRGLRKLWKSPLSRGIMGGLLVLLLHWFSGRHACGTGQEDLFLYMSGAGEETLFLGLWKSLATGFTVGAGGSAGMVGPTFFVGSMGGTAFAHWFHLPPGLFALLGAAALLGGSANVPLGATIFLVELLGVGALVPGALLCGTAYFLARGWDLFDPEEWESQ